jgi:hypothetical protein
MAFLAEFAGAEVMGKYFAYMLASTKRLSHFRKRVTTRTDSAITAALNLLWEESNEQRGAARQEQKYKPDA